MQQVLRPKRYMQQVLRLEAQSSIQQPQLMQVGLLSLQQLLPRLNPMVASTLYRKQSAKHTTLQSSNQRCLHWGSNMPPAYLIHKMTSTCILVQCTTRKLQVLPAKLTICCSHHAGAPQHLINLTQLITCLVTSYYTLHQTSCRASFRKG
jgi:hypothetical protein